MSNKSFTKNEFEVRKEYLETLGRLRLGMVKESGYLRELIDESISSSIKEINKSLSLKTEDIFDIEDGSLFNSGTALTILKRIKNIEEKFNSSPPNSAAELASTLAEKLKNANQKVSDIADEAKLERLTATTPPSEIK